MKNKIIVLTYMSSPATEIINRTKTNLEQISKLVYAQKLALDRDTGYINIDTTNFQSVTRYMTGQDRTGALNAVTENVKLCMHFILMIYELIIFKKMIPDDKCDDATIAIYQEKIKLYKELIDVLVRCTAGLNALLMTYGNDISTTTVIHKMIQELNVFNTQHKSVADKL